MTDAPCPMKRAEHWNRWPLLSPRRWPRAFMLAMVAAHQIDRAVADGSAHGERIARARFDSALDAIAAMWPQLMPVTTAAEAEGRQRAAAIAEATARAAAIMDLCALSGRMDEAEAFIIGGLPANDVRRVLQATGANLPPEAPPHA